MLITEQFMTGSDGALLDLTTWADDTAQLWIDNEMVAARRTSRRARARLASFGCEPGEGYFLDDYNLGAAGPDDIPWVRMYQVGVGTNPPRTRRPSLFRQHLRGRHAGPHLRGLPPPAGPGPGAGDAAPGGDGRGLGRRGRLETTPGGDRRLTGNRPELPARAPSGAPSLFSLAPCSRLEVSFAPRRRPAAPGRPEAKALPAWLAGSAPVDLCRTGPPFHPRTIQRDFARAVITTNLPTHSRRTP